jgi:hypothetical protein
MSCASSVHITKLKQSICAPFDIYDTLPVFTFLFYLNIFVIFYFEPEFSKGFHLFHLFLQIKLHYLQDSRTNTLYKL